MSEKTDAELVEMVRERGDTASYGELIKRYQGHAYGLAYSLLGDWAEAQDMAQEAFIRGYINLHTLENPAKFAAWLRRIVFSVSMTWLQSFRPELYRSIGREDATRELDAVPDTEAETPMDHALKTEMSTVVLEAIAGLPQKYRIPLTMFHLDGLSFRKVADFLDIPIGTVKSLINRAKKRLKPTLESYAKEALPIVGEVLDEHKLSDGFARRTMEIVDGLHQHEVRLNQLGNLLASARHLGYKESDAWLAGATAFAFALNVGEDLCPSGPSAWADHKLLPLASNAGLHVRTFYGDRSQPDFADRQKQAFTQVREAIDRALPVIGCEMSVPEVYLVPGYDNDGHYWFLDFEKGKEQSLHHEQLGFLWFQFPTLGPPVDHHTTVREALLAATRLAEGKGFDSPNCGLRAYGNWIKGLKEPEDGEKGYGAAYNAACWADSRQFAAPFLREAKLRLADGNLSTHFGKSIRQFDIASEKLREVSELFPLEFGKDKEMAERFRDNLRRRRAREALSEARGAEIEGFEALKAALQRM